MSEKDPHLVLQNCYLQMVKCCDQLTTDLNMAVKDRVSIINQILHAYERYKGLEKVDGAVTAGSAARKFESAFQATNGTRRPGVATGPTGPDAAAAADAEFDNAPCWSGPESPAGDDPPDSLEGGGPRNS